MPTTVWFPTGTLVDDYRLDTPSRLPPGVYTITTGTYTRGDLKTLPVRGNHSAGDQVILGQIKVVNPGHTFGHPRRLSPLTAAFGDQISLRSASVQPTTLTAGIPLLVDLQWRALTQPTADYTVFVHLLDARGRLVAQHDGPPLAGTYPTSDWDAGDTVDDTVSIPTPPNLPAGPYQVEAGLYQLKTGIRLRLPTGASSVRIGAVVEK